MTTPNTSSVEPSPGSATPNFFILEASADYSGITRDSSPIEWIQPSLYRVKLHTAPSDELIQKAIKWTGMETLSDLVAQYDEWIGPEDVTDELVGGDQSGTTLSQTGNIFFQFVSKENSPEEYQTALQEFCDTYNSDPESYGEKETMEEYMEESPENFTEQYRSHYQELVFSGSGTLMSPRISLEFQIL
jgi:hypothetical protein